MSATLAIVLIGGLSVLGFAIFLFVVALAFSMGEVKTSIKIATYGSLGTAALTAAIIGILYLINLIVVAAHL